MEGADGAQRWGCRGQMEGAGRGQTVGAIGGGGRGQTEGARRGRGVDGGEGAGLGLTEGAAQRADREGIHTEQH
jgi:hypothetical protein